MSEPQNQKEIEETSADLAYLAYQLRKLVERAATVIETERSVAHLEQRRRERWLFRSICILSILVVIDVLLHFI